MIAAQSSLDQIGHIRRIDLSKDLPFVADLIETCFPIHQDPDGQTYIREMRKAARDMRMLGWLKSIADLGNANSAGFVWEEDGKILGNLSLIAFRDAGKPIHLIANVAVHPGHRRKGIGRALTTHALGVLRRMGEKETWLQVRDDNPAAIDLYHSVGFVDEAVRTTWRIRPNEIRVPEISQSRINPLRLRSRKSQDWALQKDWLLRAYPNKIRWNFSLDFNRMLPGMTQSLTNFLDNVKIRHWAFESDGACQGVITIQKTDAFAHNLWIAFPEDQEEQLLAQALAVLLRRLPGSHPLSIDYPRGRFQRQFDYLGFHYFRSLIWMSCRL